MAGLRLGAGARILILRAKYAVAAVEKFADHPAFECFGQTMSYAEVDRASRRRRLAAEEARRQNAATGSR